MFQDELPTLVSRFTLQLPAGWHASGIMFNHANVEPTVAGSNYTWELRDLPAIPTEPMSPAWTNIVPRLAVSYFPPARRHADPQRETVRQLDGRVALGHGANRPASRLERCARHAGDATHARSKDRP